MVVIHGAIGEKVWLWLWKQWGGSLGIRKSCCIKNVSSTVTIAILNAIIVVSVKVILTAKSKGF